MNTDTHRHRFDGGHRPRVLSFTGHIARLRARLAKELLEQTPDQATEARLWGDRDRRAS